MPVRKLLSLLVPLLGAAIALSSHHARAAATTKSAKAAKPAAPAPIADFAALSGSRARACDAPADPALGPIGPAPQRSCAWSGRLELAYWSRVATPGVATTAGACLPAPAIAWHRLHTAAGAAPAPPWNAAWAGNARVAESASGRQALAVWRAADGGWSAVLWRWHPADGADTRAWEAGHWQDVVRAARSLGDAAPASATSPLLQAWLDASAGRPRALDGDTARWVGNGACLALHTSGFQPSKLSLPWSRDDARLEQRTGMQVQLARRMPQAEWLQPFSLLDPTLEGKRTGAKFYAIWKEGPLVQGQLWIPLRDGSGIVRARLSAPAAAGEAPIAAALTALVHAWEVRHE